MLILTRRTGESLRIGNNATITILNVRGDRVRLGIDAPDEIPVNREELFELAQAGDINAEIKDLAQLRAPKLSD